MSGQNGEIELMDVRVVPLASVFAFADGYRRLASADQQKISAVLPRWFTQDTVPKVTVQQRMDLLIAASSGVQTIPVIESRKDMTADGAGNFTKAIGSALDSQSIRPLVTHMATYGEGTELPEALHKDGYHVIRILSPEEASHFVKEKQSVNRDLILIKGHGEKMEETMNRLLHFIPVDRLIVQTDSASTLPAGMSTAVDFTAGTERGAK
jgi:hypothetical protein